MIYMFPALGLIGTEHPPLVLLGVGVGSALWCLTIIFGGAFIRRCLGQDIQKFKTIVGSLFILFGIIGVSAALL